MRQLMPGLFMLEGMRIANVYLLAGEEGLTLVDSGLAGEADKITAQIEKGGHDPAGLHTLILSHAHGDHAGNAAELARRYGVKILAHRDEAPYIEKTKAMPASSFFKRVLNWLSAHVYFRQVSCRVDRILNDGETIPAAGGLRVIHTPGHTPGSICLYQPRRKILLCGDTLFAKNPMTGRSGLQFPLPMVSVNMTQVRESVRKLTEMPIETVCFGHGEPILEGAGERIRELLEKP